MCAVEFDGHRRGSPVIESALRPDCFAAGLVGLNAPALGELVHEPQAAPARPARREFLPCGHRLGGVPYTHTQTVIGPRHADREGDCARDVRAAVQDGVAHELLADQSDVVGDASDAGAPQADAQLPAHSGDCRRVRRERRFEQGGVRGNGATRRFGHHTHSLNSQEGTPVRHARSRS